MFRGHAGDLMFIPGGMRHNEIEFTPDMRALEVVSPARFETVKCDQPDGYERKPDQDV